MKKIKIDGIEWIIQDVKGNVYTLKNNNYIISKLIEEKKC